MSIMYNSDPMITAKVIALVLREKEQSLSPREWQYRLAGYGYAVKDTDKGQVIETLPHGVKVGVLPVETVD